MKKIFSEYLKLNNDNNVEIKYALTQSSQFDFQNYFY